MATEYVVTDEDGAVSFSSKDEHNETFKTLGAAQKRARELAAAAPGASIRIYAMVEECMAKVAPPQIVRATTPQK